jgi:hypothetical protein
MPSIIEKFHAWRLWSAIKWIFSLANLLASKAWIAWTQERKTLADPDIENGEGIIERSEVRIN